VTEGFSDVLSEKQLDDVYCAALNLSGAVAVYLTMAIKYWTDKNIGKGLLCTNLEFAMQPVTQSLTMQRVKLRE
jgi:hypothetical protein